MTRHTENLHAGPLPLSRSGGRAVYLFNDKGDVVGCSMSLALALPPEEQEANARLWAASPKLLKAVRLALPCLLRDEEFAKLLGGQSSTLSREAVAACEAAIAKAEGPAGA